MIAAEAGAACELQAAPGDVRTAPGPPPRGVDPELQWGCALGPPARLQLE